MKIHIASLSGGRDSTAMTVRMLELGMQLDYIVFMNTGKEFEQMYQYLDKLHNWLIENYNIGITILQPKTSFNDWCFGQITRGEQKGKIRGLPKTIGMDYCTRELKVKPIEDFIDTLKIAYDADEIISYVGYVARENRQSQLRNADCRYPLKEWGWNEEEVTLYLKERRIYNALARYYN